jgi:hypothetical protein
MSNARESSSSVEKRSKSSSKSDRRSLAGNISTCLLFATTGDRRDNRGARDHTCRHSVVGRFVDNDKTSRGAVAPIAVDSQRLLNLDCDSSEVVHI